MECYFGHAIVKIVYYFFGKIDTDIPIYQLIKKMSYPLIEASRNGNIVEVKELLKAGADINQTNKNGFAPLHWVAYNGHTEIVELLLKAGANPKRASKEISTALYYADFNGYTKIIKLLKSKPVVLSLRLLCLNAINIKQVHIPNYFPKWLLDYDNYELQN